MLRANGIKLVAAIVLFSTVAQAAPMQDIDGVEIVGNQRIDSAALIDQIKSSAGKVSSSQISADIKSIYSTGFFSQVTAVVSEDRVLRFTVTEKPLVRKVFIEGNKAITEKELADKLTVGPTRYLDRAKLEGIMEVARTYYQSRGYYEARLTYSVAAAADNQVDVTFRVEEGKRFKIRDISFRGLDQIGADELSEAMQTKTYSWWKSWLVGTGRLNKDMLDNDVGLIRQWFVDHGLLDATISEPQISASDGAITIAFDIVEGPEYRVGSIGVRGDLIESSSDQTIDGIDSKVGEVFSASTLRSDSFKISDKFADIGYAFANVVPNTAVNRAQRKVSIDFTVAKGNPVVVNRITITGNDKTYDNVIRRELKIAERDRYSGTKVRRSETLLRRLGYFDEVGITNQPSSEPDEVDLNVNVREGNTGSFSAGVGFSSSDGALFNVRLAENNAFGTGRSASINVDVGTERENIILSYNDRRLNDTYVQLGVDVLRSDRQFDDFDRVLTGGGVELGYPLEEIFGEVAEDISASVQYEYLDIEIKNIDQVNAADLVKASAGTSSASTVTPKLVRNTIDNPLNPTKGSKQILSLEYAGLGGEQEYYLFEARNQWYYPLIKTGVGDIVFSWRAAVGYGETVNDEVFPLFKRYFLGGINSVRGFKNRSLGPKDSRGNEYGGSKQLVSNFEVIFPLIQSAGVRGLIFYDLGEAFDDNQAMNFSDLRSSYGFGVRWASPVGPFRIEVGFPNDRQPGEKSVVTAFSFGAPF